MNMSYCVKRLLLLLESVLGNYRLKKVGNTYLLIYICTQTCSPGTFLTYRETEQAHEFASGEAERTSWMQSRRQRQPCDEVNCLVWLHAHQLSVITGHQVR